MFFSKNLKRMQLGVTWGKIFRRSIIEKYNLRFNEKLRFNEDSLFNQQYFYVANGLYITPYFNYNWRVEKTEYKYPIKNIAEYTYTINALKKQYDKLCDKFNFQNTNYIQGVYVVHTIRLLEYEIKCNAFKLGGYNEFKSGLKDIDNIKQNFKIKGKSTMALAFFFLKNNYTFMLFLFVRLLNPFIRKLKQ